MCSLTARSFSSNVYLLRRVAIEPAESAFGLAQLVIFQKSRGLSKSCGGLGCSNFQDRFLDRGIFSGFEVLADPDAMKPAGNAPGRFAVSISKSR